MVDPRGPRPTANARGKVSSIRCSFGGRMPSCAERRSTVERRSGSSASANGLRYAFVERDVSPDPIASIKASHQYLETVLRG